MKELFKLIFLGIVMSEKVSDIAFVQNSDCGVWLLSTNALLKQ